MSSDPEKKIDEFCAITGGTKEMATSLLAVCNGNLEMAINMHMEGVQVEDNQPGTSSASSNANSNPIPDGDEGRHKFFQKWIVSIRTYLWFLNISDDVRAPIPQKKEVLIQPGYEGYSITRQNNLIRGSRVRSVFDGFRNFSNESSKFCTHLLLEFRPNFPLIFLLESNGASSKGKKRTLEELFKPPLDIMFKGDFQSARDAATSTKKYLMVNIQDACEFPCQVLNRDVWSNEAVKTILKEHFIFWQVS